VPELKFEQVCEANDSVICEKVQSTCGTMTKDGLDVVQTSSFG
jgi:hypothetical protein